MAFLAAIAVASPLRAERPVLAPVAAVEPPASQKLETAIFAGGCFWGVEGVFSHVNGVRQVISGYAGGPAGRKVDYDSVSGGRTGFAEAVRVTFDPKQVSYGTLLRVFFSVIADPTTLNYQGPDHGTQYRTALFPSNAGQDRSARAYLAQLGAARLWRDPIVTRIEGPVNFQAAETYHQNFLTRNPRHPYIRRWDMPKLAALKAMFPKLYRDRPSA